MTSVNFLFSLYRENWFSAWRPASSTAVPSSVWWLLQCARWRCPTSWSSSSPLSSSSSPTSLQPLPWHLLCSSSSPVKAFLKTSSVLFLKSFLYHCWVCKVSYSYQIKKVFVWCVLSSLLFHSSGAPAPPLCQLCSWAVCQCVCHLSTVH